MTGITAGMVAAVVMLAHGALDAQSAPDRSALVLDASGPSNPGLKAYREIPVGATVALDVSTRLVVLHYDTCRTITIEGGTVTFRRGAAPAVRGGTIKSEVQGQCPRKVAGSGATAATISRSLSVALPGAPAFVLVGRRADDFARVRILQKGKEIVGVNLDGPRFAWPAGVAPLAPGLYQLNLVPARESDEPVTITFTVSAPPAGSATDEAITLMTVN